MKSVPWLACGVIAGSAMACAAWAQPASPPAIAAQKVSLPVAIDAAWQRALSAREVDGQRRRAQAEQTAAGSLWAAPPSLWLGYRDDRIDANKSGSRGRGGLVLAAVAARPARCACRCGRRRNEPGRVQWPRRALAHRRRGARGRVGADGSPSRSRSGECARRFAAGPGCRCRASCACRRPGACRCAGRTRRNAGGHRAAGRGAATAAGHSSRWTLLTGLQALPEISETSAAASVDANMPITRSCNWPARRPSYARKRVEVECRPRTATRPNWRCGVRRKCRGARRADAEQHRRRRCACPSAPTTATCRCRPPR